MTVGAVDSSSSAGAPSSASEADETQETVETGEITETEEHSEDDEVSASSDGTRADQRFSIPMDVRASAREGHVRSSDILRMSIESMLPENNQDDLPPADEPPPTRPLKPAGETDSDTADEVRPQELFEAPLYALSSGQEGLFRTEPDLNWQEKSLDLGFATVTAFAGHASLEARGALNEADGLRASVALKIEAAAGFEGDIYIPGLLGLSARDSQGLRFKPSVVVNRPGTIANSWALIEDLEEHYQDLGEQPKDGELPYVDFEALEAGDLEGAVKSIGAEELTDPRRLPTQYSVFINVERFDEVDTGVSILDGIGLNEHLEHNRGSQLGITRLNDDTIRLTYVPSFDETERRSRANLGIRVLGRAGKALSSLSENANPVIGFLGKHAGNALNILSRQELVAGGNTYLGSFQDQVIVDIDVSQPEGLSRYTELVKQFLTSQEIDLDAHPSLSITTRSSILFDDTRLAGASLQLPVLGPTTLAWGMGDSRVQTTTTTSEDGVAHQHLEARNHLGLGYTWDVVQAPEESAEFENLYFDFSRRKPSFFESSPAGTLLSLFGETNAEGERVYIEIEPAQFSEVREAALEAGRFMLNDPDSSEEQVLAGLQGLPQQNLTANLIEHVLRSETLSDFGDISQLPTARVWGASPGELAEATTMLLASYRETHPGAPPPFSVYLDLRRLTWE